MKIKILSLAICLLSILNVFADGFVPPATSSSQIIAAGGATTSGTNIFTGPNSFTNPSNNYSGVLGTDLNFQISKQVFDQKGVNFSSPIGWEPHFYLGGTWTEADALSAATNALSTGISGQLHGQYSLNLTHWQVVSNNWMYVADTNKFPRGFNAFLNDAHSMGCIVKVYLDSVNPFGGDAWMTNSSGQNVGGWTNVLVNLTNLAKLYPTLDGLHYDANFGEDTATAYYRAMTVDNVWRSLITNRHTFFEHDTFPPNGDLNSLKFNGSLFGGFPDGTLFGLLSDPATAITGTNGVFNYLLQTIDYSTNVMWMFPQRGKFIQPQEFLNYTVSSPGIGTNGYAQSCYFNMAGEFGWGTIISSAGGGIANYTASSGPPDGNARYWTGLWATNQEYLAIKNNTFSQPFLAASSNLWQVWSRDLGDGSFAVLLLNRSTNLAQNINFNFNQIGGISSYYYTPPVAVVRDVFYGTNYISLNLVGYTNTLQPNYLGEPAKLFRVWLLYQKPVDATQLVGIVPTNNLPTTQLITTIDTGSSGLITKEAGNLTEKKQTTENIANGWVWTYYDTAINGGGFSLKRGNIGVQSLAGSGSGDKYPGYIYAYYGAVGGYPGQGGNDGSASFPTPFGIVVASNSWAVTSSITNTMPNFSTAFHVSSNGTPVDIYMSNGVPFIYYETSANTGILP